MARLKPAVKRRKEEARASEATRPAVAAMTPVLAEGAASRLPVTELVPWSLVANPQEEAVSVVKQTPGHPSSALLRGVQGLRSPLSALLL